MELNLEQVSEPRRGIPAFLTFGYATPAQGGGLEPARVEHAQFGITWDVTGILDHWQHPGRAEQTLGKDILTRWWLLKVSGPLPGCAYESGEFVIEVSHYGDRRC